MSALLISALVLAQAGEPAQIQIIRDTPEVVRGGTLSFRAKVQVPPGSDSGVNWTLRPPECGSLTVVSPTEAHVTLPTPSEKLTCTLRATTRYGAARDSLSFVVPADRLHRAMAWLSQWGGPLAALSAIFAILVGAWKLLERGLERRRWKRRVRAEPDQHVLLGDVLRSMPGKEPEGLRLLRAYNAWFVLQSEVLVGAAQAGTVPVRPRAWVESIDDLWRFVGGAVPLAASVSGPAVDTVQTEDAVDALKQRLNESRDGPFRAVVAARGGTGKTACLARLFFLMVAESRGPEAPVPLLARAKNLRTQEQLRPLQDPARHRTLEAFVDVWLQVRAIEVEPPQRSKAGGADDGTDHHTGRRRRELMAELVKHLRSGRVVLLLDGADELRALGAGGLVDGLLEETRRSVITDVPESVASGRSGRTVGRTVVGLREHWDDERIKKYVSWRLPRLPPEQVEDLMGHLRRSEGWSLDAGEPHWLRRPRNLDYFMSLLHEPERTGLNRAEVLDLLESRFKVIDNVFDRALRRIDGESRRHEIERELFRLAMAADRRRFGRTIEGARAPANETVQALRGLTELLDGDTFAHPVLRDHFLAGRIATELLPGHGVQADDEIVVHAEDRWTPIRIRTVAGWLDTFRSPEESVRELRGRLRLGQDPCPAPMMRLNLLMLLVHLLRTSPEARAFPLSGLELRSLEAPEADLGALDFERCDFSGAQLAGAKLVDSNFRRCCFDGADLTGASAVGASFLGCHLATADVGGLLVDSVNVDDSGMQLSTDTTIDDLVAHGATDRRSRYDTEFGRRFLREQQVFLGTGLTDLENIYRRWIREELRRWPEGQAVYLIDLMAGGSTERLAELLAGSSDLRVLGVDRDPAPIGDGRRLRWVARELPAEIDLQAMLRENFGVEMAEVVVAKKALHELPRAVQPSFFRWIAGVLRPGGALLLFADTPGPDADVSKLPDFDGALQALESLRSVLSRPRLDLQQARAAVARLSFRTWVPGTARWAFCNAWVLLKDWANDNRHEVQCRSFASRGEIRRWAADAGLVLPPEASQETRDYRLSARMFNEVGISRALWHLARQGTADTYAAVVQRDFNKLSRMLAGDPRLHLLAEFTATHLGSDSPMARKLETEFVPVDFANLAPALASFNPPAPEPVFNFPCTVFRFRRPME